MFIMTKQTDEEFGAKTSPLYCVKFGINQKQRSFKLQASDVWPERKTTLLHLASKSTTRK